MNWLLEPGTNQFIMRFADANSIAIVGLLWLTFRYLEYRAQKTASKDDDELVAKIEQKVMGFFHRSIDSKM